MWRTREHTGDVALEVEASGWSELLGGAARAFGEWLSEGQLADGAHTTERALEVRGVDRVETWVGFWRALHRLWTVEGFLAVGARVEGDAEGRVARARVSCVSAGALDPSRCLDVKAVTWHDARVESDGGTWRGTIVLDL